MKLIPLATAIGLAFGAATVAHAMPTGFDLITPDGTLSNQDGLDWNENGSGVSIGNGPFGTPFTPGDTFLFNYQANLVTVSPDGGPPNLKTGSNGGTFSANNYEFTIAVNLFEVVDTFTPIDIPNNQFFASFGLDTTKTSKISIFFDDLATGGTPAATAAGTGFVDGKEILRMTITDGPPDFQTLSSFFATGPTGQGSTKIYAALLQADDFIDEDYIVGATELLYDIEFQSNLNFPAGASTTTTFFGGTDASGGIYPSYTYNAAEDILFKVDGSNQFSPTVPVPAPLYLIGAALTAFGFWTRKRRAA
jgi:hypothetical protein